MFKLQKARQMPLSTMAIMTVLFFIAGQIPGAGAVTVTTDMDGSLIKGSAPDVYFMGTDAKRYVFPDEKVFFSWYEDFSTVKIITDEELATYPLGGNVIYKPGTRLVKIPTDPKVYAVATDGTLRWISTEELAKEIFGDNWTEQIDEVPVSYIDSYQIGAPVEKAADYVSPVAEDPMIEPPPDIEEETPITVPSEIFKIVGEGIGSYDANNNMVSDVRTFTFTFNRSYTGARLVITEKNSNAIFRSDVISNTDPAAVTAKFSPDAWTTKLKPNTAYSWKVIAYAAPNATADEIATASGEFTTVDFASTEPTAGGETPNTSDFAIVSVGVDKLDALGAAAEDVRSFNVVMSLPSKGVRLIIAEKESGAQFYSVMHQTTASTLYIKPSDWTAKLKPNTAYTWKVVAYSASTDQYAISSGEFTTTAFGANAVDGANGSG